MTRRKDGITLDARFKDVRNSNAKYLVAADPDDFGEGIWSKFDYDLTEFARP